jgi:uncharacterized FlaG/YvyC family protein
MEVKAMEVKLSLGGAFYPNSPRDAALGPSVPRTASAAVDAQASKGVTDQKALELSEDDLRELLQRTVELVSAFDRNLKFEVIENVLQIQVIDSSDGTVVRKIPPDEVIKLVTYIKDKLSDNMNVLA